VVSSPAQSSSFSSLLILFSINGIFSSGRLEQNELVLDESQLYGWEARRILDEYQLGFRIDQNLLFVQSNAVVETVEGS
jgi:hypothetical protein